MKEGFHEMREGFRETKECFHETGERIVNPGGDLDERIGKLVSAIHGFEVAEAEATQAGSSAIEVPAAAKQHAEALRARIAHLRVEAGGRLLKSRIFVDDAPVVEKDLGTELDVDPGDRDGATEDFDVDPSGVGACAGPARYPVQSGRRVPL